MKPINRKYITTVGLIWSACLIVLFFVYMLLLAPQARLRKEVEKSLAEEKQAYDLAEKAAEAETQARLREQAGRLQERLKDFVIDLGESANLTFDISRTAGEQGIGSFSIKNQGKGEVSKILNCDYIGESRIDVSFSAGFNQFATFLNAMERHEPVVFVDRFSITRSEQQEPRHQVKVSLAVLALKPAEQ